MQYRDKFGKTGANKPSTCKSKEWATIQAFTVMTSRMFDFYGQMTCVFLVKQNKIRIMVK